MTHSPSACEPGSIGAFFDVDGTLMHTTIVHFYARLMTDGMSRVRKAAWTLAFAPRIPLFLVTDRVSRAAFNRQFYRLYRGLDASELRLRAEEVVPLYASENMYEDARAAVRSHTEAGHIVALVTGTADFIAGPVAQMLGIPHVLGTELAESGGRFTGEIAGQPLSGVRKAETTTEFALAHEVDLQQSYAYGDSTADADMLGVVGKPVAINPSRRMTRYAMRQGWDIRSWR
jgi:alcohol-forming fatty acyl-CoA reductase